MAPYGMPRALAGIIAGEVGTSAWNARLFGWAAIEINSSVMNASGPRSAERGEIYELSAVHRGAVVFKSCNIAGLEQPENLKNSGVEYFAAIARELHARQQDHRRERSRQHRR